MLLSKTYQPKASEIKREWHLIDAKSEMLGRLATKIAGLLMGKGKRTYSAHMDSGDYVVVTNARKVPVTGNKEKQKIYYRHSGYPGGLHQRTLAEQRVKNPTKIIELAVYNMLPKNKLRGPRMARLKIFSEESHPYDDKLQILSTKS